ncbi:MAG: LacI family DNA-binding transcriptional regulator [Acidimicrobiia bacterium]
MIGDRLMRHPTILDVANEAGVSKSLVSLVMRGSVGVSPTSRKAVLEAASRLGYRPNAAARTMVRQRSYVVGVMVSNLHNPFFADVIDGIDGAVTEAGYRAILTTGNRAPERELLAVATLLEMRVDGLILTSPVVPRSHVIEASQTVPTVIVGKATRASTIDSVTNDDRSGGEMVVDHLVELGHRRIAHIDGGLGAGARPRRTGYKRAMRRHGLEKEIRSVRGNFAEEGGGAGMKALLADPLLPTAVFVANDLAAIGVLEVLNGEGLDVPGDISVAGYDNTALAAGHRSGLTTVDQPRHDMGRMAAELVLERISTDRTTVRHVVLSPKLVARESSGPPRP